MTLASRAMRICGQEVRIRRDGRSEMTYEETVAHLAEVHRAKSIKIDFGINFCQMTMCANMEQ